MTNVKRLRYAPRAVRLLIAMLWLTGPGCGLNKEPTAFEELKRDPFVVLTRAAPSSPKLSALPRGPSEYTIETCPDGRGDLLALVTVQLPEFRMTRSGGYGYSFVIDSAGRLRGEFENSRFDGSLSFRDLNNDGLVEASAVEFLEVPQYSDPFGERPKHDEVYRVYQVLAGGLDVLFEATRSSSREFETAFGPWFPTDPDFNGVAELWIDAHRLKRVMFVWDPRRATWVGPPGGPDRPWAMRVGWPLGVYEECEALPEVLLPPLPPGYESTKPVAELLRELAGGKPMKKYEAAAALGRRREASAVVPLTRLATTSPDPGLRFVAVQALGTIADARAGGALVRALGDTNDKVRRYAALALQSVPDVGAVGPLLDAIRSRRTADGTVESYGSFIEADALRAITDERAVDPLTAALEDSDAEVRMVAADVLGRIGDRKPVGALSKLLSDEDLFVRKEAAIALGRIADPAGVEALGKGVADRTLGIRRESAWALAEIGTDEAAELLNAALERRDHLAIAGAYLYFIRRGDPATENALTTALKDWGNLAMVRDYLLCGNENLAFSARLKMKSEGLRIPGIENEEPTVRWGEASAE